MNKIAYSAQGTKSNKFDRIVNVKRETYNVTCDYPSKVKGFIFTWALAIGTGYAIVHFLIPLIAR